VHWKRAGSQDAQALRHLHGLGQPLADDPSSGAVSLRLRLALGLDALKALSDRSTRHDKLATA
jgi:hypothetical protein